MLDQIIYWRMIAHDRLYLFLTGIGLLAFIAAITSRHPNLERSTAPFDFVLTFLIANLAFSLLTIRREPLLSYVFQTANIILAATLYLFFRSLLASQGGL